MNQNIALVFDMDGVIVDSNPVHTQSWQRYLAGHGIVIEEIERRMHGKHNDAIVEDFFGREMSAEEIFAHGAAKERVYREMMAPQLEERLVAGVREFLERHRGEPMAVASNAEGANVQFVLDGARLKDYFRVVIDGHQVERPKPDPQIYLATAAALGIRPENCIVFEDSPSGVEAARKAGMRVVGVMTTHEGDLPVELQIRDFTSPELERWLKEQKPR